MFQEGLLQPSEAADAAAVVKQLRVHPLIAVLLDRVVPHDVHLLGVHAAHRALVANVEMVHLNVNSQSVLVGGSESANSARPPLKKRVVQIVQTVKIVQIVQIVQIVEIVQGHL